MDGPDAHELVQYLLPEPDEVAIISAVTRLEEDREEILRSSLIIGPPSLGEGNWSQWQLAEGVRPIGQAEPQEPSYVTFSESLRTYRIATDIAQATEWLSRLLTDGESSPVGLLPSLVASLQPPVAPLRLSPRLGTDASTFLMSSVRSATGFMFRDRDVEIDSPTMWSNGNEDYINSPLSAGLHCAPGSPGGLVLARLERRAWFVAIRGGEGLATFICQIGLDPERIEVSDLAVSLDEWVDGELVHSQQVWMDDIDVEEVRGKPTFIFHLPTLGTQVERSVRLHDQHGTLLDASRAQFAIFESVELNVRVIGGGGGEFSTTIGERRPVPRFVERSEAVEKVKDQYQTLYSHGAESSLFASNANVHGAIRDRLAQARGTLRIVDRYFGQFPQQWGILDLVTVPTEVLTSLGKPPPSGTNPNVEVRWIRGGRPPFHGRAYLWDGGGLSVDASPDGFGRDPVYVTSIPPEVSARWHTLFLAWWAIASPTP